MYHRTPGTAAEKYADVPDPISEERTTDRIFGDDAEDSSVGIGSTRILSPLQEFGSGLSKTQRAERLSSVRWKLES